MTKISKKLKDAIRKALTTAASSGGDFLPTPLAREFIRLVREQNFLRQAFTTTNMASKTKDYPKILGGTKVYYQDTEISAANLSSMTTATIQLTAKKFMARLNLSEEVIEDSQEDMKRVVRDDFANALAEAEEEAMIKGDPGHTPTTATEADADDTTWFTKDHKFIFYGLLTLAADIAGSLTDDTRASNRVDGVGGDFSTALARQAMYNMGKYGRNFKNLILIINPWSANQLLDDSKLVTLEKYGKNATIFTGEFGKLYGKMSVVNSAACTDGYGIITHVKNPIIGDRRKVKIAHDVDINLDAQFYVITSRLDFTIQYKAALCQLYNLDQPATTS